jgi:hypothetical protein
VKLNHQSLHLGKRGLRGVTDEYLLGKQAPQLSLLPPKGIHHIDCSPVRILYAQPGSPSLNAPTAQEIGKRRSAPDRAGRPSYRAGSIETERA